MKKDELLKKQLKNLNSHLPKGRASLAELQRKEKPRIETRDGSVHRFKKEELEYLANLLPEEEHSKLRLPIIMRISPGLGRGTGKISGEIEKKVLKEILDKEKEEDEELLIYRPEIRTIRKKLPSTTQYAFLISSSRGGHSERTK